MSGEIADPLLLELQRQATIGRLLGSVAHEMSAPLGSILSNRDVELRLLDRIEKAAGETAPGTVGPPSTPGTAGPPGTPGPISTIKELVAACRELARVDQIAAERINRLVRSVKIAARAADTEPQRVQVNEVVESALDLAKTEFRSRITTETDFGSLPDVECQPHLLSQAVLNLVTNAGQAIEGTGTITVGTRLEGDSVHIWVADTGRGIRQEDRQKVLKQGFTTKPLGVGTGLGLLIVQRIVVEDHGGSVDFESECGRGTTFHIRIPVQQKRKGAEPSA